jgi:hypothetical protein
LNGCKDCAEFEKQLKIQQQEIALLKFELDQFKSDFFKRRKKKESPKQNSPEAKQKKKGGLFGHTGSFRETPKKIDIIIIKMRLVRIKKYNRMCWNR